MSDYEIEPNPAVMRRVAPESDNTPLTARVSRAEGDGSRGLAADPADPAEAALEQALDAMRFAFRASGGIATAQHMARLMEDQGRSYFMSLEKLIATGAVFGFAWQRNFWLPMFQFDPLKLSVKPGSRAVLAELITEFDGWGLALWFAQANKALNETRPVDLLESDLPAVVSAARGERLSRQNKTFPLALSGYAIRLRKPQLNATR